MAERGREGTTPVRRWIGVLGGLWAAALAANRSLVRVEGESMRPTLVPGQLLATLPAWLPGALRPGRIVVTQDPRHPDRTVVKRVERLEAGSAWLVGDNPIASTDSRVFGSVPTAAIRRVVVVRLPARQRSQGARPAGGGFG